MTIKFYRVPKTKITASGRRYKVYGSMDYLIPPKEARRKTLSTSGGKTCSICKFPFIGFGNNPQPVNHLKVSDRCCDECNKIVVLPRRWKELNKEIN